jgi:hypothetical protein
MGQGQGLEKGRRKKKVCGFAIRSAIVIKGGRGKKNMTKGGVE